MTSIKLININLVISNYLKQSVHISISKIYHSQVKSFKTAPNDIKIVYISMKQHINVKNYKLELINRLFIIERIEMQFRLENLKSMVLTLKIVTWPPEEVIYL